MEIRITKDNRFDFRNNVDYCVGTGKMGLALHKEYYDQLAFVQKTIGFSFIRGHGLFCDDVAIYQEYTDADGQTHAEYNFTYLDRVIDSYIELGIRPFLELGFMPERLASGTQTIFYWKGNVTPPKEYADWCALVQATLHHLLDRYGNEVLDWPIEVWNEPNLPGFWKHADMQEYFRLYEHTVACIKALNPAFRVGGPAICGGADEVWMKGFLSHCSENRIMLDFITRHHYTTHFPEREGHYQYVELYDSEYAFSTLKDCRAIIESYPEYKDLPFYITEFNSSYVPNAPLHDTNENAAYLARMLSEIGDYCTGYSYWTFGDVFEEQGVPYTPFHGGFGLVANGIIPKPTFHTFAFFKHLKGEGLYRDNDTVLVTMADGSIRGIVWNLTRESKQNVLTKTFDIDVAAGEYFLLQKLVDEDICNPLKVWHHMGEPANPTREQIELLREAAAPQVITARICAPDGRARLVFSLKKNAVLYFELRTSKMTTDRGFHYLGAN